MYICIYWPSSASRAHKMIFIHACMCMYMSACLFANIYAYGMYVPLNASRASQGKVYSCVYVCMYICAYVYNQGKAYACVYACMNVYVHIYSFIYICIYVCICHLSMQSDYCCN